MLINCACSLLAGTGCLHIRQNANSASFISAVYTQLSTITSTHDLLVKENVVTHLTCYIIFYQQGTTHFLLVDCDQQRHFHYSTCRLLITEIPFPICAHQLSIGLAQFYFLCNCTHTQPFNGPLSGTTRVGRYQKKHSPTHTHPASNTLYQLPPSNTIYSILYFNLRV